jgi:hypothetical protein
LTYIGNDGSITICSPDSSRTTRNVYIYEYTKDMVLQKTTRIQNLFTLFGAFTKDSEGNYYVFSAENANNEESINMALVKYDSNGNQKAIFNSPMN